VSVHALHPLYVDLAALPGAETVAGELAALREELEPLAEIDYPRVMAAKWQIARHLFDRSSDAGLDAFVDAEWWWLGPYVRWCVLRDRHGSPDPRDWGGDARHDPERVDALLDPDDADHDDARFHAWMQWHLRRQLDAAADHAHARGVALKGDLPIGVSPTSVEVWTRPELFHVGAQTGAPPDAFAEQGQNWGFPTYDWEAMAADGHAWWRRRFAAMARTFDAYRIDHVLGFFRIWEIPEGETDGRLGRFRPCLPLSDDEIGGWLGPIDLSPLTARDGGSPDVALLPVDGGWHPRVEWRRTRAWAELPEDARTAFDAMANDFYHRRHARLWEGRGRRTLGAVVTSTDLLACGEDLGMVPDVVPGALRDLGVLSLEIGRMPKSVGAWRSDPRAVPYLTVVSTGTHDMPPLRLWWRDDPAVADRYWREVLGRGGAPPADPGPDVCRDVVREQLASPAMLCVLPIQDLLATRAELRRADPGDEQINRPSDRDHRWRYRLHVTVTDLRADRAATEQFREDVRAAGRC
jgi:4-alpha-glucanotransferase